MSDNHRESNIQNRVSSIEHRVSIIEIPENIEYPASRIEYRVCKTNPILSAVGGLQMNVSIFSRMAYENKSNRTLSENKPNSNPISVKPKMSANVFVTKDYENKTAFRLQKNKPNQSQFPKGQNELKIACQKIWPHPKKLRFGIKLAFSINDI